MDLSKLSFTRSKLWEMQIEELALPKQSAKFGSGGAFTPARQKKFIKLISQYAELNKPHELFDGSLELQIVVVFPFPKSAKKSQLNRGYDFHVKRPDFDNLSKPLCDALSGIIFTDDARVCKGSVIKLLGPKECIFLRLSRLSWSD